jgi:hypothetical protein
MAELDHAHDNMTVARLAEALEQLQQQLAEGSARLTKQRAQYQAMLHEVKLARAAASDSSWDLADVEQRLNDLKEQREGPGDLLMEREIAHLTGRRAKLEERVLTQLLLVDDLIARTQVEEQALASAEQDWAMREAILIAKRDHISQWIATADRGGAS